MRRSRRLAGRTHDEGDANELVDGPLSTTPLPDPGLGAAQRAAHLVHARPDASAERSSPVRIERLLSTEEIAQCHAAASACGRRCEPATAWRRPMPVCAALSERGACYDVVYSPEHVAIYLHREGHLGRVAPSLLAKLVETMRARAKPELADPSLSLRVRCVELHSYAPGGSLLDAGHKDTGSRLTLSVQLSGAAEFGGGQFTTWAAAGEPVTHSLEAGDAVLIHSEKLHNVATITSGIRSSLVCELWAAPSANVHDRFS
jgi:hypothetical protein